MKEIDPKVAEDLKKLMDAIFVLAEEGEQVFIKAGGQTVGEIEKVGESDHLKIIEDSAGKIWHQCLPLASQICAGKGVTQPEIAQAYASKGIFSANKIGAIDVAESILRGEYLGFETYFPIGHINGMATALRFVLEYK